VLPVPVYSFSDEDGPQRLGTAGDVRPSPGKRRISFFALDRPAAGTVPVHWRREAGGIVLTVGASSAPRGREPRPLFHALPADAKNPPATAVPLYEFAAEDGTRRAYSTDNSGIPAGYRRSPKPICLVWRNPIGPSIQLD
jgi:hypothetical protein